MHIKRRYTGLNWLGEKMFYERFCQLERLGFRRYRESQIGYWNTGFYIVLPEGWTFETMPPPNLPSSITTLPFKPTRYVALRDEQCRIRATLIELRDDADRKRQLSNIWLATYFNCRWTRPELWEIVDGRGEIRHQIEQPEPGQKNTGLDLCEQWLDKNYPDWRDPFAYWDE